MELRDEFVVATDLERAWDVLTDVERIAPCLPGAELREIEGEEYRGVVKVKVGPITAEYKGAARFARLDRDAHTAVLVAEGREARGQGNASATVTAVLEDDAGGTKVSVVTDLTISGKVAQFGRGVLADVSGKILRQFVDNLESTVLAGDGAAADEAETAGGGEDDEHSQNGHRASRATKATKAAKAAKATRPARAEDAATDDDPGGAAGEERLESDEPAPEHSNVRRLEPRNAEPVDLLEVAGPSVMQRVGPIAGAAAILALVALILRRILR
ncbi:MAG TPA: SRPBCC family protein [Acidimicrobiales bacterium]|nr:SRPBCC family protein [Acidimicrobiales bacterium]